MDGEVISSTEEHPFWTPDKGWIYAKDLTVGSLLLTEDGRIIDVDGVNKRKGKFEVYNFNVEGVPVYFVSDLGILVHNTSYNPLSPDRIDSSTLNLNDLLKASQEPYRTSGLTKAGRALDKHASGQRGVSPFPPLRGNNANKNRIAEEQVVDILSHPDAVVVKLKGRGGIEVRVPNERGIRFNNDGSFSGFVD